ncbi:hypothetical protein SOASR030_01630 [Leminorella grimontii]|uniref:Phage protein n=1 Tax=Leminorella grimontii TaxID=82981 RepID=A0AAV5MW37_9GAMM|nr:hypothetical protein [Leminorella grimontii]KFC95381.1 phage protein [Leminorella grimontii ATCC 33999 = DSM 5078]GKX54051.1 hypothetical protein SOASR030_01630 [Leminorella grimontii]VFS60192.1 Uncharacterised protein [Leminorella grimontii]
MSDTDITKSKFEEFIFNLSDVDFTNKVGINKKTADNIRQSANKVMDIIPDDTPATEWNIDDIVESLLLIDDISDSAVKGYKSRVKSAVKKFIAYSNGKPIGSKPRDVKPKTKPTEPEVTAEQVKTFELPIPLRSSLILNIANLPTDLTEEEAERVCRIIKSYAVPARAE